MSVRVGIAISTLAFLLSQASPVKAQSPAELFRGKTVNILIGFGAGGEDDVWAHLIAQYLGKHLPGNPTIVPQNVPGAGSLRVANQIYNVSPKDGTAIGMINRGVPFEPLLGGKGIQFDPLKMNFVGSPSIDTTVCAARKDAAVQNMQDLFSKELVIGATGSGADTQTYPEFLSRLLGMKFKIVSGYPGSREISVAMERNEVQSICLAYDSLMRQTLPREGKVNILFQAALQPDSRLNDVPVGTSLAHSESDREALTLFFARVSMGRPFIAPPGMAPNVLQALRKGFADTLSDPEFVATANKQSLRIKLTSGEEMARFLAEIYKTPPDVVKRVAGALGYLDEAKQKP
jgi:tripartite-type tricarboxylate transporter receptor subunit TctC